MKFNLLFVCCQRERPREIERVSHTLLIVTASMEDFTCWSGKNQLIEHIVML